jgi:Protein of unknown function (DUF3040)
MSLAASEERALAKIERVLRSRDPLLESLFATFTALTCREALPAREQIQRRGWRPRPAALVPLAFLLIVAIIAAGSLAAASPACGRSASRIGGTSLLLYQHQRSIDAVATGPAHRARGIHRPAGAPDDQQPRHMRHTCLANPIAGGGYPVPDRNEFSASSGTGLRTSRKPAFHDRG